jgi:hypothetical protein
MKATMTVEECQAEFAELDRQAAVSAEISGHLKEARELLLSEAKRRIERKDEVLKQFESALASKV